MGRIRRIAFWSLCLVPLVVGAPAALPAQGSPAGFGKVAEATVPLDGREVAVALPKGVAAGKLRVVLRGLVACNYDGRTYDGGDAVHIGRSPQTLTVASSDPESHVYTFRLPGGSPPPSVSAWVDVDRLVTELIITPSEVRSSLSGDLRLEVWQAMPQPGALILRLLGLAAIAGLAVVGVRAWRLPRVSTADVKQALKRIDAKHRLAIAAVDSQRWDAGEVRSQLTRLRKGARDLAKHIASLRRAAKSVDRQGLNREIEQNEARLGEANQQTVREEVQRTLDSKRRLRELLADAEAREARYLLRLSKIESTIESTRLWLTAQESELADQRVDGQAIESLNQELQSLDEAIAELRILDRP